MTSSTSARRSAASVVLEPSAAPDPKLTVAHYAELIAQERDKRPATQKAPDTSSRQAVRPIDLGPRLGVYRDPWFGEVSICRQGDTVGFRAHKSPMLSGTA